MKKIIIYIVSLIALTCFSYQASAKTLSEECMEKFLSDFGDGGIGGVIIAIAVCAPFVAEETCFEKYGKTWEDFTKSDGTLDADAITEFAEEDCTADQDDDGVYDWEDNCPLVGNNSQTDTDGDGIGNSCETIDDADKDGVADEDDNCPDDANLGQEDSDGDGTGDACEEESACTSGDENDCDGDEIADEDDNCPAVSNKDQKDDDSDSVGNACDPDFGIDPLPPGPGSAGDCSLNAGAGANGLSWLADFVALGIPLALLRYRKK